MKNRNRIRSIAVLTGVSAALVSVGCKSYVTVRPYSPTTGPALNVRTGLVYFLPKTLIDAKVTYSIYEEKTWKADPHGNAVKTNATGPIKPNKTARVISLETAPEVLLVTIPDPNLGFTVDPTDMVRFGVGIKDGKFEVNEDGILTSAGVTFEDKSLEAAQGFLKTGIALAKLAAVADAIDVVIERTLLKQVVVRKILDLSDFTFKANSNYVYNFEAEAKRHLGQDAPMTPPKAELLLTLPDTYQANASATSKDVVAVLNSKEEGWVRGIVSRIPAKVRVRFAVDDLAIADSYQPFAQVGGFSFAAISSRRFTAYTTGVTVSPTRGSLTQFSINVTSAAAALAASSQSMSETTATTVKDFSVDQMNAETARLNAEADLIKARKALDDAKKP